MKTFIETSNPCTDEVLGNYPYHSADEIETKLKLSKTTFEKLRGQSVVLRCELLRKLAVVLRKEKEELARLMSDEMGKILSEARAEVEKCANEADYYAQHGAEMLADEKAPVNEAEAYVSFLPLGPVLAVMPWNFPYWQVTRFAIPALLAGNTVLLKHASNVTGCALALESIFKKASFPEGVFQTLVIPSESVAKIIEDSRIQAVTLTGSVGSGKSVAQTAGAAIKKSVLELGGSDAFIVLKDANIELAVKAAVQARFSNAGQVCIAAKRFFIEEQIADEFQIRFLKAIQSLVVGNPLDSKTQIGPLAKKELRDELHAQVQSSVKEGAQVLCGGRAIPGAGNFYEPTLMINVKVSMSVFREETFGPVAALMRVKNAEEAIQLCNQSIYGLSSNLWTQDLSLAKILARQIEAGSVFINSFSHSDPRVPIGGIKASGYGRELSHFGPKEFMNIQTVWIGKS